MLIVVGVLLFAGALAIVIVPEWRANYRYVEGACVVLDKRIAESRTSKNGRTSMTYRPDIHIRYQTPAGEHTAWTYDAARIYSIGRSGKEEALEQFRVGSQYPCWYDPEHPDRVVLVRGWSTFCWIMTLTPLALTAAGMVILYRRRARPE